MRRRLRDIRRLLYVVGLTIPGAVGAQETRVVSGVVVEAASGAPVADAMVTIRDTGLRALTDAEGRFAVSGVPLGSLQLVLRHVAYGEHSEAIEVGATGSLDFRIRVSTRAIELAPLGVEVSSRETQARRASGTATHVIDRATIEMSPLGGQGLLPILQSRIPSLRVHGTCVEYRVLSQAVVDHPVNPEWTVTTPCRDITVYVDGVPNPRGSAFLRQLSPEHVERIQVLSPSEAGLQYASGSRGVILVDMRQGVVTEARERIHVNGFGWSDPQPYPWLRVLGISALGNAAVAGLTSRTVFDCDGPEVRLPPVRCNTMAGPAGALLTSAIGLMITRRAGRTSYTEGRTFPALLMGAATASVGYMLYLHGENQDSDASRTAGQIVLAVGIPITLTLSDRVFRMVR